jgi:trehalose/maltose hydrolase-like predicted phosphorylase
MLMYRFNTLPSARAKAANFGFKGALYAWESADTGVETTPERVLGGNGEIIDILTGRMEHHISADVAYAAWRYWHATGDDDLFVRAGAEILLETARFWASRAVAEADGRQQRIHQPDGSRKSALRGRDYRVSSRGAPQVTPPRCCARRLRRCGRQQQVGLRE